MRISIARSLVVAATGLGLVASAASPAFAGETQLRSIRVGYGDLDLASSTGRAQLDKRIHRAAGYVWGAHYIRELSLQDEVQDCRNDAVARAKRAMVEVVASRGDGIVVAAN